MEHRVGGLRMEVGGKIQTTEDGRQRTDFSWQLAAGSMMQLIADSSK